MTPQAPAARRAPRLIAASLVLMGLAPAAGAHAQRVPADPPAARPAPAARPDPSATPAPAAAAADEARPSDILTDRPDLDPGAFGALLGETFESKGQGIALRPPKDAVPVRRAGAADFVEFVNPDKDWTLKISKIKLEKDGSLTQWRDAEGNLQPGLLEHTATRLKEELPDAEFLRQEKIHVGAGPVGMIVLRHARNLRPLLSQQAIIEKNLRTYYLIALTTPGGGKGSKDPAAAAGGERVAVEAFGQVLDSVRLLDQQDLRAEQDARLFGSRALLVNLLPDRVRRALVKEQWTRVLRKGKDVGYATIRERVQIKGGQEGVEVAVRSRVLPDAGSQVDTGSILFASMDLRHEDWSTLSDYVNLKQRAAQKDYKPPQVAEFGISDRRAIPGRGDDFSLQVIFESTQEQVKPVTRPLPPFYLPQAFAHLLPRLVPLNEPKALLFTVWVPESREVILRYVDVRESRRVDFNGELVRCVPVEERIGLDGPVTTHYMSHGGQWLGSENKESGITVLPTTEATLLKLWKDAILDRPDAPAREAVHAGPPAPGDDAGGPRGDRQHGTSAGTRSARNGNPGTADNDDVDAPRPTPAVGSRRRPAPSEDQHR